MVCVVQNSISNLLTHVFERYCMISNSDKSFQFINCLHKRRQLRYCLIDQEEIPDVMIVISPDGITYGYPPLIHIRAFIKKITRNEKPISPTFIRN